MWWITVSVGKDTVQLVDGKYRSRGLWSPIHSSIRAPSSTIPTANRRCIALWQATCILCILFLYLYVYAFLQNVYLYAYTWIIRGYTKIHKQGQGSLTDSPHSSCSRPRDRSHLKCEAFCLFVVCLETVRNKIPSRWESHCMLPYGPYQENRQITESVFLKIDNFPRKKKESGRAYKASG